MRAAEWVAAACGLLGVLCVYCGAMGAIDSADRELSRARHEIRMLDAPSVPEVTELPPSASLYAIDTGRRPPDQVSPVVVPDALARRYGMPKAQRRRHKMTCDCGARREVIETWSLGSDRPHQYLPGALTEPCTCPVCVTCGGRLVDQRCPDMDCPLYDTLYP